jgi:hypothetical protein
MRIGVSDLVEKIGLGYWPAIAADAGKFWTPARGREKMLVVVFGIVVCVAMDRVVFRTLTALIGTDWWAWVLANLIAVPPALYTAWFALRLFAEAQLIYKHVEDGAPYRIYQGLVAAIAGLVVYVIFLIEHPAVSVLLAIAMSVVSWLSLGREEKATKERAD